VPLMQKYSRSRKISLALLCYQNACRYLKDAKILKKHHSYGHSYSMVVLGIEQLGMALIWHWRATGLWDTFPEDFKNLLIKGKMIEWDHKKKQSIFILAFFGLLAPIIIAFAIQKAKKQTTMDAITKKVNKRLPIIIKRITPIILDLDRKKMQGFYVDGFDRWNAGPDDFGADDVNKLLDIYEMLLSISKDDFKFFTTRKSIDKNRPLFDKMNLDAKDFFTKYKDLPATVFIKRLRRRINKKYG
jgi:AbiV family abortive infection protein